MVLVFLLVYGVQKEMPSSNAPPPSASVGSGQPETVTATRENRQKAGAPVRPPTGGSDRETSRETGIKETRRRRAPPGRGGPAAGRAASPARSPGATSIVTSFS